MNKLRFNEGDKVAYMSPHGGGVFSSIEIVEKVYDNGNFTLKNSKRMFYQENGRTTTYRRFIPGSALVKPLTPELEKQILEYKGKYHG